MIATFRIHRNIYDIADVNNLINPAVVSHNSVIIDLYDSTGYKLSFSPFELYDTGEKDILLMVKKYQVPAKLRATGVLNEFSLIANFNYIHDYSDIRIKIRNTDSMFELIPYESNITLYGYDIDFDIVLNDVSFKDYPFNRYKVYRGPYTDTVHIVKTHSSIATKIEYKNEKGGWSIVPLGVTDVE